MSVKSINSIKMGLAFAEPWWKKLNISYGMMITTLPAKKVYYWGASNDNPLYQNNSNSLLLFYVDGDWAPYWEDRLTDYASGTPFYFANNSHYQEKHELFPLDTTTAIGRLVIELTKQLSEAHNITIPFPYAFAFYDWSRMPFGAGYSFWEIGANSFEVQAQLRQPKLGDIYVCGDTYSDEQGWIEGALRSCEKALIQEFGLQSKYVDYLQCA